MPRTAGVAVDSIRGKVYWTTTEDVRGTDYDSLWRANLTGNQVELIAQENGISAIDVAIDAKGGRVYWAKGRMVGDIQFSDSDILVANVAQGIFSALRSVRCTPTGVVVGNASGSIYWSDVGLCGFNSDWPPLLLRRGSSDGLTFDGRGLPQRGGEAGVGFSCCHEDIDGERSGIGLAGQYDVRKARRCAGDIVAASHDLWYGNLDLLTRELRLRATCDDVGQLSDRICKCLRRKLSGASGKYLGDVCGVLKLKAEGDAARR